MLCLRAGAFSALISPVLLTGATKQVYSSGDITVTFIQGAPAAASPQEAHHRPAWASGVRKVQYEPCLSWHAFFSQGSFAVGAESPVAARLCGAVLIRGGRMGLFHLSPLSGNTSCRFSIRV